MQITILTENFAGGELGAEHGLSYLIEVNECKLLFDTGHSDLFIRNAISLGINLQNEVDVVVLSHGHWDHGNGLKFITGKDLICHPEVFMKRYRIGDRDRMLGLTFSRESLEKRFHLILSREPYELYPNVFFLGSVPRITDFEALTTKFETEGYELDFVPDDSGLAIVDNDELVLITGCAHSGVCNMLEHAIDVTGVSKVKAIIGGFHLKSNNFQVEHTVNYLKQKDVSYVYPSHCTGWPVLSLFHKEFNSVCLKTGDKIVL